MNTSLGVYSVSKIQPQLSSYFNFTQIEKITLTSKNVIFNRSSFANFETFIGFVASKQVWKWSQILIPSPVGSGRKTR